LASAESRVEQALLSLARTQITVPFNAMVRTESAEVGQIVSSATTLGTLVGTDEYWVEIGVPLDDVASLDMGGTQSRSATLSLSTGGGDRIAYEGQVAGLTGSVDSVGRLARLLVKVPDPLEQSAKRPVPLLLGSYVEVTLEGPEMRGVRRLPRAVVREGNQVWIVGLDSRLAYRPIEIVGGDADSVLVRLQLADGEAIVESPVAAAAPGMLLMREASR
ncbi:MAG: HlyD family efflux transporter periplasmic adaptor subunit, partial [Phycisphaerales bacterium]|nr:HlyD family efflux transporter periplasmic adaptor subunit [Phycisphaerales bacterium]